MVGAAFVVVWVLAASSTNVREAASARVGRKRSFMIGSAAREAARFWQRVAGRVHWISGAAAGSQLRNCGAWMRSGEAEARQASERPGTWSRHVPTSGDARAVVANSESARQL